MPEKIYFLLCGLLLSFVSPGYAGDAWYVRDDVSGGSGQQWSAAWNLTELQSNWTLIKAGDTVYFAYDDTFGELNITVSGSADAPVTFEGAVYDTAAMKPVFGRGARYGINIKGHNFITLNNLKVSGSISQGYYFRGNAAGIIVNHCDAAGENSGTDGFHQEDVSSVTYNDITATGYAASATSDGLSLHHGAAATVNGCILWGNGNGLSNEDQSTCTVNNALIYNNRVQGGGYGIRLVNSYDGSGILTVNNALIYDNIYGVGNNTGSSPKTATVTINNTTIHSASIANIYLTGGTVNLNKCFLHNAAVYATRQQTADNTLNLNYCFIDGSTCSGNISSVKKGSLTAAYCIYTGAHASATSYAIELTNAPGNSLSLYNCVIAQCGHGGVYSAGSDSKAVVRNCIFYENANVDLVADALAIEDHNCFYGTKMSIAGKAADATDLDGTDDPKFLDPQNNDFMLLPDSPCIDRGISLGSDYKRGLSRESSWSDNVVTADQDAAGSGWEIGAYVFTPPAIVSLSPQDFTVSLARRKTKGEILTLSNQTDASVKFDVTHPALATLFSDPAGDVTPGVMRIRPLVDITGVEEGFNGNMQQMRFEITFADSVVPGLIGYMYLDIDRNPATGEQAMEKYYGAGVLGYEYLLNFFCAGFLGMVVVEDASGALGPRILPGFYSAGGTVFTVDIPLPLIGNTDGHMNIGVLLGNRALKFDAAPDSTTAMVSGEGTFIPWLKLSETTGTLGPYETRSLSLSFDATRLQEGTYADHLTVQADGSFVTEITVPVTLTVHK